MEKQIFRVFEGTEEQEKAFLQGLEKLKDVPGGLMPALQLAQEIYGYLPKEVQVMVANELNVPLSEVYGVATFYSQFSLSPKGKYQIGVCLGTACYVKGSGDIYNKLVEILGIESGQVTDDKKFSLDATRCVGCCGLAPVMTINGEVYGKLKPEDVPAIIEKYKAL
ncbi:MAG: NAD(P)H-dependent oxidoreductase subunit E [Christensenellaceae bacterium]